MLVEDKVLPNDNFLPNNYEEEKQLLKKLGVDYMSYNACPKDYILYGCEYMDKEI
jgi:hypothetical protein